jgi:hypothetical protein
LPNSGVAFLIERERVHAIVIAGYAFGLATRSWNLEGVIDGAGARAPEEGPGQGAAP